MSENLISRLLCPVCGNKLEIKGRSYVCINSHCFDMAKSGYVNLLMSNRMNAKDPGDNKLMVRARNDFLCKGYYGALLDGICKAVSNLEEDIEILDAGCGEGYYTSGVFDFLKSGGKNVSAVGIDISKHALNLAAKRNREIEFAVGSVFHMPVGNESCNLLMSIFAPFCLEEFLRVLKPGGYFLMVVPGERHLWQLKSIVYDKPYENELKDLSVEGFEAPVRFTVHKEITLENNEDIMNLFSMTPYYYRTGEKDKMKLYALESLTTEIEFEILLYRKKGEH